MSDRPTPTKRKSVLSELGIKPGGETKPTKTTTSPSTPLTRKNSVNNPSSPSVSRTRSVASTTSTNVRKKATPSTIKVDRTASTLVNSPTSPSPRRRSIVPTTSSQKGTMSPLSRRSSLNVSNSTKRVGTLESLEEDQTNDKQLKEKDEEIQRLKTIESECQTKISALEFEVEKLRKELKQSLETRNDIIGESKEIDQSRKEPLIQETEDKLLKTETKLHKSEMENLIEQQEKKIESELATLKVDLSAQYDEQMRDMKRKHENEIQHLKSNHHEQIQTLQNEHKASIKSQQAAEEKDSIISNLKEQLQAIKDDDQLRKVQLELDSTLETLKEVKKSSQQELESLERRHREEIIQLQTGKDGTTEASLEKNKSMQQELSKLQEQIRLQNKEHEQSVKLLKDTHTAELAKLRDACDQKESQMEAQSHQIKDLSCQVETLQKSFEEATVKLEPNVKSTPSNTTQEDSLNQKCVSGVDTKQTEIEELRAQLSELKETHKDQLNKLTTEKAKTIQDLQRQITALKLASATPPQSPIKSTATSVSQGEDRLIRIAEQHRNELKKMHIQYQNILDSKNKELEDYAYREKAIVTAKQKEIEKYKASTTKDIMALETKVADCEKESVKLKERVAHWEMLSRNNEALIQDLKKGCATHIEENAQLTSLVSRLQSEIHH